ncbi:MAG: hypothetical protein AB7N76_04500 [Planctomycetota bacterium]
MSDRGRRELERRAAAGDPDAAAALLAERARAGELGEEDLALLAHCGHPGAASLRPRDAGASWSADPSEWASALQQRFGAPTCARAALACALACPVPPIPGLEDEEPARDHALELVEAALQGEWPPGLRGPLWTVQHNAGRRALDLAHYARIPHRRWEGRRPSAELRRAFARRALAAYAAASALGAVAEPSWGVLSAGWALGALRGGTSTAAAARRALEARASEEWRGQRDWLGVGLDVARAALCAWALRGASATV